MDYSNELSNSLMFVPELSSSPGLAVPLAGMTGDTIQQGQAIAHVNNVNVIGQAMDDHAAKVGGSSFLAKTLGWFGHEAGNVAKPVGEALNYLGAPLREVQHQYRYFHDVWQQHGALDAILEAAPVALAAVGGGFLGGTEGAALAAETAAGIEGRLVHPDSWKRVENGEKYLDSRGQQVSLGRDITSLLGLKGHFGGGITSGLIDGIADLTADPLALAGKARAGAMSAEGAGGALGRQWGGLSVNRVEQAYDQYGSFRRAAQDMADTSNPMDIVRKYGRNLSPIANDLAKASTPEAIVDVFRNTAKTSELLSSRLPTRSLTKVPFSALNEALRGGAAAAVEGGGITDTRNLYDRVAGKFVKLPEVWDSVNKEFSAKAFRLGDDNGAVGIYHALRQGQNEATALEVANRYLNSSDPAERIGIVRNAWNDMFDTLKIAPDEEVRQGLFHKIEDITGGEQAGKGSGPAWARDPSGRRIDGMPMLDEAGAKVDAETGKALGTKTVPILPSDTQMMPFPDVDAVKAAARANADGGPGGVFGTARRAYGGVDQFMLKYYTNSFFKKFVLMSGSFAAHVAVGELIPEGFRQGFGNLAEAKLASAAEKFGYDSLNDPEAVGAFKAALWKVMRPVTDKIAVTSPEFAERMEVALGSLAKWDGHLVPPVLDAGHHYSGMVKGGWVEAQRNAVGQMIREIPDGQHLGEAFGAVRGADANNTFAWQHQLGKLAEDPASNTAASAWVEALDTHADQTHDIATKAANDAAEAAVRRALKRTVAAEGEAVAPEEAAKLNPMEAAAQRAARRAAREAAEEDIPPGVRQAREPKAAKELEELTDEQQETVEKARQAAYDAAKAAAEKHAGPMGEAASAKAATGWLDAQPEGSLDHNPRHTESIHDGLTPHQSWGRSITDAVKGSTHGPNGTLTRELLEHVANGTTPTFEQLQEFADRQPAKLISEIKPAFERPTLGDMANNGIHRKLSSVINWMSREPIYQNTLYDEYKIGIEAGLYPQDAHDLAETRAANSMIKRVHNLDERTYLSEGLHNFSPFFFAQQQAWARYGRLFMSDPGAFRQAQLLSGWMQNIGSTKTGADGQQHLMYPGMGWMTGGTAAILKKLHIPLAGALPIAISGNLASMAPAATLTERELSISPLVAVAAGGLKSMFPEMSPALEKVFGAQALQSSAIETLIPNTTMRRTYEAINASDRDRGFMNTQLAVIQQLAYEQEQHPDRKIVPDQFASPLDQQQFLDRVRNQTRYMYLVKAAIGAVSPLTPTMSVGNMTLKDEVRNLIKTKGAAAGLKEFSQTHPDATAFTVFDTESTSRSPLAATSTAGQWIDHNLASIQKYSHGGAWLIPQDHGPMDGAVYNEQLALRLRQTKSPEQYLKDIYIASSNKAFYDSAKPTYDAALKQVKGDALATKTLKEKWSNYLADFGAQNPVWYDDYRSPTRMEERTRALADFQRMESDPDLPASPQWDGIKRLVDAHRQMTSMAMPGRRDQLAVQTRQRLDQAWDAYLTAQKQADPTLEAVINKVFLPLKAGG
jgi:chemotaxis protein histidine kinase CheA